MSRHARLSAIAVLALWILPVQSGWAQGLGYPSARKDSVVDSYHGVQVPDPYRWLEDQTGEETRAFVAAQNQLTSEYLGSLPPRAEIQRRLNDLARIGGAALPWQAAGHLFYMDRIEGRPRGGVHMQASPDAPPRVVLDLNEVSPDGTLRIGSYAVSPRARYLGYSRSRGGTDADQELIVRDLATGRDLPDVVRGSWWMIWTEDERGFFYPRDHLGAERHPGGIRLYYHRLGTAQGQDRLVHSWPDSAGYWFTAHASEDGRYLLVQVNRSAGAPNQFFSIDLQDGQSPDLVTPMVQRLDSAEARYQVIGTVGDTLYALTNLHAPNWRVVRLDLKTPMTGAWQTVIAENTNPITDAVIAGGQLVLTYTVHVKGELHRFALDGSPLGQVQLPGMGSVWLNAPLVGRRSSPHLFYEYVSFLTPRSNFRYDFRTGESIPLQLPQLPFDPDRYETRQLFFASKDGTRVPMFVVARKGLVLDGSHPTMLEGYGGYGSSMAPYFRGEWILWLEMGGVAALANIRGGGEYGEEWHRAGMREKKQNSFDDFIAAAEYLVQEGYTSPSKLGILGSSNGGLLIGAVITQRPDLFGVAIPQAGHHDMLRYHRFTNARNWIPEYGSSDDPDGFRYLFAYSPLHNIRPRSCYPATLILAREQDDRVVPSHSYKFAAALQAAQVCDRPILLRVGIGSHGFAPEPARLEEATYLWTFAASRLGARLPD